MFDGWINVWKSKVHQNTSGNSIQNSWDKNERDHQSKISHVNPPNTGVTSFFLRFHQWFITNNSNNYVSILDNGLLKCALVITDTTRNVSHTQNSYSLCDQERRHTEDSRGDSVSVPGKSGSHRLKYESLRKLRAVCSLDPRVSTHQGAGSGKRTQGQTSAVVWSRWNLSSPPLLLLSSLSLHPPWSVCP